MRGVIFDLDGTLADSAPDIAYALNGALAKAGLAPFSLAEVTAMVGAGARRLVERALAARGCAPETQRIDATLAYFLTGYSCRPCAATALYPGAQAALDALARDGWELGICTNKPDDLARRILIELGIADCFAAIVGGRDGVPLKPAPDMVALACRGLGVASARCVFVGDSKADVGAARAARLPVILMGHGYSDEPADTLGADAIVHHFERLAAACERLLTAPARPSASR